MLSHQRHLGRHRRAGRAPRPQRFGARQARRPRRHRLQPLQAHQQGRARALAVDREHRQDPRGDRRDADELLRRAARIYEQPQPRTCRCSASRRPAPAASSTARVFPSARAGTRSPSPPPGDGTYALEVTGNSMLPLYRDGDTAGPVAHRAAPPRRPRGGADHATARCWPRSCTGRRPRRSSSTRSTPTIRRACSR